MSTRFRRPLRALVIAAASGCLVATTFATTSATAGAAEPAAPAAVAPAPRGLSYTALPTARFSGGKAIKSRKKRSIRLLGRGGLPTAGLIAVRAQVTVKSRGRGKVRIAPTGFAGQTSTIRVGRKKTVKKTLFKNLGSAGRWTVQNKTGRPLKVTIAVKGFTSTSVANSATPCARMGTAPAWDHVVWIVLENHGPAAVVKNAAAPYLNSMAAKCGLATNMWAVTHPSLPNYLALASGSTQGVTDSGGPASHPLNVPSIFSQLGAGRWRTLAQSMPANCHKTSSGAYVARHNPALYFTNIAGQCAAQNVPMGATPDLSAPFTFIIPDLKHNAHDLGVRSADNWLKGYLPKVLDSPQYQAGRTAVFVFFDENGGGGAVPNPVPMFVMSPSTPAGARVGTHLTHYSTLRATQEMLGLGYLGNSGSAADMRAGFRLR